MEVSELTRQSARWMQDGFVDLMVAQLKENDTPRPEQTIRNALTDVFSADSSAHCFVVLENANVIAACLVNLCSGIESGGKYLWINELHVYEKNRRRGVGSKLLNHVVEWAETQGCQYIAACRNRKNRASFALFKKAGWEESEVVWMERWVR